MMEYWEILEHIKKQQAVVVAVVDLWAIRMNQV